MQIKVKNVTIYKTLPVAVAKLVLVELSHKYIHNDSLYKDDYGNLLICYDATPTRGWGNKKMSEVLNTHYTQYKAIKPILISETEKIEVGDSFYASDLPHDSPSIFKAIKIEEGHSGVHGKVWVSDNDYIVLTLCKKILALPEHFSPKHLQAIVDGKLKPEGKVAAECERLTGFPMKEFSYTEDHIKLNPHITLHPVEEKIYTREEVIKIVRNCCNYFFSQGIKEGTPYSKGGDNDYMKWFDNNVK